MNNENLTSPLQGQRLQRMADELQWEREEPHVCRHHEKQSVSQRR